MRTDQTAAVLARHSFTAEPGPMRYTHDHRDDLVVHLTRCRPDAATIAAREPGSTQRYAWEIELQCTPPAVLDATLRAVCALPTGDEVGR